MMMFTAILKILDNEQLKNRIFTPKNLESFRPSCIIQM